MIAVAVGDEKMRKRRKIRTVTKTVTIRIGGEIEEKSVVQYRLRTLRPPRSFAARQVSQ